MGVKVPDDKSGCLQDVHWSHGSFGYFATYSIGSLYAAQMWNAIQTNQPDVFKQLKIGNYNNYKIFKNVYFHSIEKLPLYNEYPLEYFDHNHYGPVFSLLIATFAILPDYLGIPFWGLFNAGILAWAITQLPLQISMQQIL